MLQTQEATLQSQDWWVVPGGAGPRAGDPVGVTAFASDHCQLPRPHFKPSTEWRLGGSLAPWAQTWEGWPSPVTSCV